MTTTGYGMSQPVADNTTAAGRRTTYSTFKRLPEGTAAVPTLSTFLRRSRSSKTAESTQAEIVRRHAWGSAGKGARYLGKLRRVLGRTEEGNRKLILYRAQKMAKR